MRQRPTLFATPWPPVRGWLRRALPAALIALVVGCGGGGGDSGGAVPAAVAGPPTTGASLTNSSSEAAQAAQAAVAGADAAVARASTLSAFSTFLGRPISGTRAAPTAARKQALAVSSTPCDDWVDVPCTGSATLDTNVADTATVVGPGDYADIRFAAVSGPLFGNNLVLNGRMRLDFLSTFDVTATQVPALDVRVTLDGFGGSVNGKPFGPINDVAQLQIDSQGVVTMTAAGTRYRGLTGITVTGLGDYVVGGGTVRTSYWTDPTKYVDLTLQAWRVAAARPAVGSRATLTSAVGSISVIVTSSASASVVYAVAITSATGNASYVVTATYPPGGGAPTYTAVPA